ncbi:MAG: hypothetical protein ACXWYS_07155 [Gaiellaceae bacterium]
MARVTILAALVLALTAGASLGAADPWAPLYRPLHLPALAPGAPCPIAKLAGGSFARYGVGRGLGPGPAYPIGFRSVLKFPYPPDPSWGLGDTWGGTKVLWFVAPRYRGRVLVRGRRLDADTEVRFDAGRAAVLPPDELRIPVGWQGGRPPGIKLVGQRYMPSNLRLRESGCYAFQIDGTTFSRPIVFRAVAVPE